MASIFEGESIDFYEENWALTKAYEIDKNVKKILMTRTIFITEIEEPWLLEVVKRVEHIVLMDKTRSHDYLPTLGLNSFSQLTTEFLLGTESTAVKTGNVMGVQTLSGIGGLRLAADLLHKFHKCSTAYISKPGARYHDLVLKSACFRHIYRYRYWDEMNKDLDFEGLIEDLQEAPERSVVFLSACAHDPTGCDPTKEQWIKIADVMEANRLIPVFECVFLGLKSGSPEEDAWAVRYFVERGFEMCVTQSFSKSFGLYNERVGSLNVVVKSKNVLSNLKLELSMLVTAMYSSPPWHGARIVATILGNERYRREWIKTVENMASRIKEKRIMLRGLLEAYKVPGNWEYITQRSGLYALLGLNETQVKRMLKSHHIYMFSNGRVDFGSLNSLNMDHFVRAVSDVLKER